MDVALTQTLVHSASAAAQARTADAVNVAVLKKALSVQQSAAATLLSALPVQPAPASTGPLGTRIDAFA